MSREEPVLVTKSTMPPLQEVVKLLEGVWERAYLTNNGPLLQQFERLIAARNGVADAVAVANGTLAIELLLEAFDIKGEVITTPFTFPATATAICRAGAEPVFVDTNISIETLKNIADKKHVLIMLADPQISVRRFFERPDREKQFLYRLIMEEPDPERAMDNYRQGLTLINSQENYDRFLNSGFQVILRDENRSIEETLELVEKAFGLI